MPMSIPTKLGFAIAVVALGSASAAAQGYMGYGRGYYAPPPPSAYGYAPPAYGYLPPPAYGYAPPPAYGYAPPVYGYYTAPGGEAPVYDRTPPYNPYYFGTGAWWNEREREGSN
jgi:hypothetical protein